ncbi:MAG: PilZ domain-containing protein [Nitrospirae bacterium]|nr:PilZ domain-containing protein [Nitrospirota bacterium]
MAKDNLCLLICDNYKNEAASVIEAGGFKDVKLFTFPPACYSAGDEKQELSGFLPPRKSRCGRTVFLGSHCADRFELPGKDRADFRSHLTDQCFYMFANKNIIDAYLKEKAYILTPGFLSLWRQCIKEMGLDKKTAGKFFKRSFSKLVLLDTGTEKNISKKLQQFSEFLNLSCKTVPVGLDHFSMFLKGTILEWRLENIKNVERTAVKKTVHKNQSLLSEKDEAVIPETFTERNEMEEQSNIAAFKETDRRMHKRFSIDRTCLVEINDSEMVELKDISLGGARLGISRPLPADSIHGVRIFPSIKNEIYLTGAVVWSSSKDPACPHHYETGLKFVNIDEDSTRSLDKFFSSIANPASK